VEAKFVDTAVAKLLGQMQRMGANKRLIKAKVAGGAQMFAFNATNDMMRIGDRNVEATAKILGIHGIPILAKDVGLTYGRTVELYAETGAFLIKTIGHGNKTL
jgi:chemotaxis protein CheD